MDWEQRSTLFQAMAAFRPRSFGLTRSDQDAVTVIQTGMVTAGFFPAVGVAPAIGRVFSPQEEAGEAHVVVLSDRLWRTQFGGDPACVGRKLFLNEEPFLIIGVMPPGFEYPMGLERPDAFFPLSRHDYCCARAGSLSGIGRMKPGVSLAAAGAELASIGAQLAAEYPATNRGRSVAIRPLAETLSGTRREPLYLLMAAASLLLLIAAANVAGLFLARGLARVQEVAIRASLGAGAWQIARPFLAESLVLAVGGGVLGLAAAEAVLVVVPRFIAGADQAGPLALDGAAFGFAFALTGVLTLLLGAVPMLVLRYPDLAALIKAGGRVSARGPRRDSRAALVVLQIAFSVVLLLSAGLLLRSFLRLLHTSPGFETAHALRFGIGLPEKRYDTDDKLAEFHRRLLLRLQAIPGVAAVGAAARSPLHGGSGAGGTFQFAGANLPANERPHAWTNVASPGYFAAMGIPLLAGREFSWRDDRPGVRRVAIVNRSFARAYLANRHAVGTQLEIRWVSDWNPPGSTWEIVGIAGDTRQGNLDREPLPEIFLSMTQVACDSAGYVIRTRHEDAALAKAVAGAVAELDPRVERVNVTPMRILVERNLENRTAAVELVGAFAMLALLLTAVGVYAMVAFRATGRSREMAIRMALGATGDQVRGLILGYGVRMAAFGVGLGLAGFLFAVPLLRSQLYGVSAFDPLSIAAVAGCVGIVALGASIIPGRRAARQSPMHLLRES